MKLHFDWTPERVDRLRALAAEGWAASWIAGELGGLTRNAVIGKIHRLGLTWNGAADRLVAGRTKGARKSTVKRKSCKKFNFMRPSTPMPVVAPKPSVVIPRDPCTLVDLGPDSCRWPLWDDSATKDFLFCNEWAAEGQPYCFGHCCMAYQPMRQRRAA